MITRINKTDIYEYYGLSTDTKPLYVPNGSIYIEMDSGKIYFYDGENTTWVQFGGSES